MKDYDLVLLLGGTGSRMGIKGNDNKHTKELNGKPVISYIKDKIDLYEKAVQPFANKYIVTNGKGLDQIMKTFGQDYTYFYQEKPTGIPDAAYLPNPQNRFLLHLGDQYYEEEIQSFINDNDSRPMKVWLKDTKDTNHTVAAMDEDGNIKKFIEKPNYDSRVSAFVATGMYMLSPYLKHFINELPRHEKNENNMSDLGNKVLSFGDKIDYQIMQGNWYDVNSQEVIKMIERYQ